MTPKKYNLARRYRGTKEEVARKLGVHKYTLDKREGGRTPITKEAELALLSLPLAQQIAPIPKRGRRPKQNS